MKKIIFINSDNEVINSNSLNSQAIWVIKECSEYEKNIFEVFSRYYHLHANNFETLYVPRVMPDILLNEIKIKLNINYFCLGMEYVKGIKYQWSEHDNEPGYGGSGIPEDVIPKIIKLLVEKRNFTNCDFQFRNLIFMTDNKVALIDYESAKFHNHQLELDASYLYILMWNNPSWKKIFLSELKNKTKINKQKFEIYFLRNLYKLRTHWMHNVLLCQVLDSLYVDNRFFNAEWNDISCQDYFKINYYQFFDDLTLEKFDSNKNSNSLSKLNKINFPSLLNKTILDIGCSSGYFPIMFHRLGALKSIGIDTSQQIIDFANIIAYKIYSDNKDIVYQCCSIYDFVASDKIDIITCLSMIHYVRDKQKFLDRINFLLSPEGLLILEMPVVALTGITETYPTRYYITEAELFNLISTNFMCIYSAPSNLGDRKVFHFKKV